MRTTPGAREYKRRNGAMYRKAEGETTWTCISTNAYSGVKTVDGKSRMY